MNRIWIALASGLYVGFVPWAPGTFGSLLGIVPALLIGTEGPLPAMALVLASSASVPVISHAGRLLGCTDASAIVLDEILGMWLSMLYIPPNPLNITVAFLLFRFFDILKPFPVGWLERHVPGGAGVLLDDLAAGLLANICTSAFIYMVGGHG